MGDLQRDPCRQRPLLLWQYTFQFSWKNSYVVRNLNITRSHFATVFYKHMLFAVLLMCLIQQLFSCHCLFYFILLWEVLKVSVRITVTKRKKKKAGMFSPWCMRKWTIVSQITILVSDFFFSLLIFVSHLSIFLARSL